MPAADLERTLRGVFRDRPRNVRFVDAGEDVPYEEVIRAVDAARGAGVTVVGLVPRRTPDAVGRQRVSGRGRNHD